MQWIGLDRIGSDDETEQRKLIAAGARDAKNYSPNSANSLAGWLAGRRRRRHDKINMTNKFNCVRTPTVRPSLRSVQSVGQSVARSVGQENSPNKLAADWSKKLDMQEEHNW